jgi:hypothetical protein
VSPVPEADFEEEPLNRHLQNIDWVAPRASAHQEVNAALLERAESLLPVAFGTIYRDVAGVQRMLEARAAELLRTLELLAGQAEWLLTLERDEELAGATLEQSNPTIQEIREQMAQAAPGRGYLLKRRLENARKEQMFAQDSEATGTALQALGEHATRTFREPMPEDTAEAPLARVTLLVRRSDEPRLRERAARLADFWEPRGYAMNLSGPWPPYRFARTINEAMHEPAT